MKNKKTIVWLLPGIDRHPVGGYKMVYEYANRFSTDGYDVHIVYPAVHIVKRDRNAIYRFLRRIKHAPRYCIRKIARKSIRPKWFALDKRVKCEYVFRFENSKTLKIDGATFIATALCTSFELCETLKKFGTFSPASGMEPCTKYFYFVQDFESWGTQSPDDVYDSYRLPLKKITIAPWLVERIVSAGSSATLVENGLDFDYFKMANPMEKRSPFEVAMLYHKAEIKRSGDAIAALKIVRKKIPSLHVTMFGTPERPDVPDWFEYFQMPDRETHNNIYNKASIFVAPSRIEGMGLTPAESMMCGCAVVCTDNPGFEIFSRPNETTLVSPACDVDALAQNILRLMQDDDLRMRLARNGNEYIKQFTWERAYGKFKTALESE